MKREKLFVVGDEDELGSLLRNNWIRKHESSVAEIANLFAY